MRCGVPGFEAIEKYVFRRINEKTLHRGLEAICRAVVLLGVVREMKRTGQGYAMQDVHRYMREKLAGRTSRRPRPVRWRK